MRERNIIPPTPERARRGVELVSETIKDVDGHPAQPFIAIDLLSALLRRNAITREMWIAGDRFRNDFDRAHFDPLQAVDLSRPMVSGRMRTRVLSSRIEDARDSVWQAIAATGTLASPGGACVWGVLGWQRTLKQWAIDQGWCGRTLTEPEARGVLITALGALAAYYDKNP